MSDVRIILWVIVGVMTKRKGGENRTDYGRRGGYARARESKSGGIL